MTATYAHECVDKPDLRENPNRWHQDALLRKHEAQLRALVVAYWIPHVLGLVAVLALVVIAWKL